MPTVDHCTIVELYQFRHHLHTYLARLDFKWAGDNPHDWEYAAVHRTIHMVEQAIARKERS